MKKVSERTSEVAGPTTSEKITEVAKPLRFNLQLFAEEGESGGEAEVVVETDGDSGRDFEKDTAFATMRREKEAAEAKNVEFETKSSQRAEWFKTHYGEDFGIDSVDGYISKMDAQKAQEKFVGLSEKANEGEDIAKDLEDLLKEHPAYKDVLQELQGYRDVNAQVAQKQNQSTELGDFNKEFGFEIESYDGISDLPNAKAILTLMTDSKLKLSDAYMLANKDDIIKSGAEKVKQDTLNRLAGKGHITPTANPSGVGTLNGPIDPEVLEEYRAIHTDKKGRAYPDKFYKELHALSSNGKKYSVKELKKKHGLQ